MALNQTSRQWIQAKTQIIKLGARSGLEEAVIKQLESFGVKAAYEVGRIPYTKGTAHYIPDFCLSNGIIIETKGLFLAADRTKHLLLQAQYPTLDIRFIFNNPHTKLSKKSKTTYAEWCDKHNFKYATGLIPTSWITEQVSESVCWARAKILIPKKVKKVKEVA